MRREAPLAAMVLACAALAACRPAPDGLAVADGAACAGVAAPAAAGETAGMVLVKGGRFQMGAAPVNREEGPPQSVTVGSFWIDRTEVTNAQFARFVNATGYVTLAERPLDPKLYPDLPPDARRPASLVFTGAPIRAAAGGPGDWWRVVPGADWRRPAGPGSSIRGREDRPVVHVAYEDALAYARWLGRDLPTEAEWEYAARGGRDGARFVWGDTPAAPGAPAANVWQGVFPAVDTGEDGYKATPAPVGCYPPNGYGLHDMAGNVWEWTRDWYRPGIEGIDPADPSGPAEESAFDPADPSSPKHVIKGGSYLCSEDFCWRYRPAARTAGPADGGASHVGFRTVLRLTGDAG
ncbi:formylglycine-generating enzyme family protein [Phenylobacterium sp.]|uniref:formylglycine-generating enzyme family protein n=1 Tax=Phenylobacterium sp. TaxID=1871053 RepID=UPI002FE14F56